MTLSSWMFQRAMGRCRFLLPRPVTSTCTSMITRNNISTSHRRCCSFLASQLTTELTSNSNLVKVPPKQDLVFGQTPSDHMLTVEWSKTNNGGWGHPTIQPYQNLSISPAASCLHYGLQCFEGMKAYRSLQDDSKIHLFRPDMNMKRLQNSMTRLHLPGTDFDHDQMIQCIGELVRLDQEWIPSGEGYALYLRPTVIATHATLGMNTPENVLMYVMSCPVGPYYTQGFQPIKLTADTSFVRAWPGGTGDAKVGGNYASTMKPAAEAAEAGYSQVLWLFGPDDEVTEVGAMNIFFVLINKTTNRKELVTAPLTRGDILPGVTRASILELARMGRLNGTDGGDDDDFDVSERFITMGEIVEAAHDDRLLEAFGAGTAAVVAPIETIQYQGQDIDIPAVGDMTQRVWDELTGIQYRTKEAPPGWIVEL